MSKKKEGTPLLDELGHGARSGFVSGLRFGRVELEPAHDAPAEELQPSASRLPGAGRTWVTTAAA